ncbi:hypothetical protein [Chromobacterium sp. IIBBL 290-4]|uniref:hypothetical protein n=1 Tax=Chromobacterium sp. IIBBL 290-4 TaxID=2953890 RepID=UPI0020B8A22D|nr:hypothetical protein [Chromobacterium sp. IIBBL 290-4]UTH74314.1 hypothetical protein NKT35_22710 [Chromobacterium sp. IIBBL 290-4]
MNKILPPFISLAEFPQLYNIKRDLFDKRPKSVYSRSVINFAKGYRGQRRFQSIFDQLALQDYSRTNSLPLPHPAKPGCGVKAGQLRPASTTQTCRSPSSRAMRLDA